MSEKLPALIVVLGPTASGKTSLSVRLAQEFGGAVVSADSRQVYKGLDIGTSKATKEEQQGIEHALLDVADPAEDFTLAQYQEKAFAAIDGFLGEGKLPFLVGGAGLYIDAVVENFSIPKAPPNAELRAQLERFLALRGKEELAEKLLLADPGAAGLVDINNPRRVIRAIEMIEATGLPLGQLRHKGRPRYRALKLGLERTRNQLYERCDQVVENMVAQGLIDEVEGLLKRGIGHDRLEALGLEYRQASRHLRGRYGLDEMKRRLKDDTHAYIRRQLTWFRRDSDIHWLEPENAPAEAGALIRNFLF